MLYFEGQLCSYLPFFRQKVSLHNLNYCHVIKDNTKSIASDLLVSLCLCMIRMSWQTRIGFTASWVPSWANSFYLILRNNPTRDEGCWRQWRPMNGHDLANSHNQGHAHQTRRRDILLLDSNPGLNSLTFRSALCLIIPHINTLTMQWRTDRGHSADNARVSLFLEFKLLRPMYPVFSLLIWSRWHRTLERKKLS